MTYQQRKILFQSVRSYILLARLMHSSFYLKRAREQAEMLQLDAHLNRTLNWRIAA